jgi:ribosomal protein L19E
LFDLYKIRTDEEDYFLRERRDWVSQLDDMLKSGMIDKKEYNELKKQFGQEES